MLRLMSPQPRNPASSLKREVGVRELRDALSRYVRHAAEGGETFVTMHGRRVARLAPVERTDPFADLRRRGILREPGQPKHPVPAGRPRPARPL